MKLVFQTIAIVIEQSECKVKQSSNLRVLFAVQFALQSFVQKISNKSVRWKTDKYTASLIVASGSNKVCIQTLAKDMYKLTIKHFIILQVKWIPRQKKQRRLGKLPHPEPFMGPFYYINRFPDKKIQSLKNSIPIFSAATLHRLAHLPQDGETIIIIWYRRFTWYTKS